MVAAVRERWGDEILSEEGGIDRALVAARVFADRGELAWLEGVLHPAVVREYLAWRAEQTAPLTVTEVPLLYETGGETRFDRVVVITAPADVRSARQTSGLRMRV